jgi:hypothetical protein
LRELRIMIKSDEGSIRDNYVAFRVSCRGTLQSFLFLLLSSVTQSQITNHSGVTLGNYYQGLYKL